jgi:hypothetical protein
MSEAINVYCDESCHLERDRQQVMVLGAVWCPAAQARQVAVDVRGIKKRHGMPGTAAGFHFEMKWSKVSPAKLAFYQEVIDYFFECEWLHFRGVIIPDKGVLDHAARGQTHDEWYYKMFFDLLKVIISPTETYRIYLDIKDTHCWAKSQRLREILCNANYDFERRIIERVQPIRSEESELLQIADLLIGVVMARNRGRIASGAKQALIQRVQHRSGYRLHLSTWLSERKFNLLRWQPRGMGNE